MSANKNKLQEIFGIKESEETNQPFIDIEEEETEDSIENAIEEKASEIPDREPVFYKEISKEEQISDFQSARSHIHNIMEKSQELLEIALDNAEGGNARDIEVAAKSIESSLVASEKLVELHEKLSKIKKEMMEQSPMILNQQNNNTINITTSNLLEKIANGEI